MLVFYAIIVLINPVKGEVLISAYDRPFNTQAECEANLDNLVYPFSIKEDVIKSKACVGLEETRGL